MKEIGVLDTLPKVGYGLWPYRGVGIEIDEKDFSQSFMWWGAMLFTFSEDLNLEAIQKLQEHSTIIDNLSGTEFLVVPKFQKLTFPIFIGQGPTPCIQGVAEEVNLFEMPWYSMTPLGTSLTFYEDWNELQKNFPPTLEKFQLVTDIFKKIGLHILTPEERLLLLLEFNNKRKREEDKEENSS